MTVINGTEYTNRQAHKILWNWLADNPEKKNEDFFKENECSNIPLNYCYACEDAHRGCKQCLTWIEGNVGDAPCYNSSSVLMKYFKATGSNRQILAREIANM